MEFMDGKKKRSGRVEQMQSLVERYVLVDPIAEGNEKLEKLVAEFNAWLEEGRRALDQENSALEAWRGRIDAAQEGLEELKERIEETRQQGEVEASNTLVARYNEQLGELEQEIQRYNQSLKELEGRYSAWRDEEQARRKAFKDEEKSILEHMEEANAWRRDKGPGRLFREAVLLMVELAGEIPPERRPGHEEWTRLMAIRQALVEDDNGSPGRRMIMEQVELCGQMVCHMLVDTGASSCSLSPEMVTILGLEEHVGDEVEVSLANDMVIKARELLIPEITLRGARAEFVKALVLESSASRMDGCLGLSFLNKFDYAIENGVLVLREKEVPAGAPEYDVFICHKSSDFPHAKAVYDILRRSGHRPFLSEVSLPGCSDTNFQKAIDRALEGATHLVIVTSSGKHLVSPWVESEWQLFHGGIRSGRKSGNILPILFGGACAGDLPFSLSVYQVVQAGAPNWEEDILKFLN
jgi:clan AA aspartic protease (TIGR02281 family)